MSNLINFNFKSNSIRSITINDNPWFIAVDVCNVLGIGNTSDAVRTLDEDEYTLDTVEGNHRKTNLVNESGLYALVFKSRKKVAREFRKWVTNEVLPSIRKTGKYVNTNPRERFLSEEQWGHIHSAIMEMARPGGKYAYAKYFSKLKRTFEVSKCVDILKIDYKAACHAIGIHPKQDLLHQIDEMHISKEELQYSANWIQIGKHHWSKLNIAMGHFNDLMDKSNLLNKKINKLHEEIIYYKNKLYDPLSETRLWKYADDEKVRQHLVRTKTIH